MREFTAVRSSLTCKIVFANVIRALPTPGTAMFPQLFRELKHELLEAVVPDFLEGQEINLADITNKVLELLVEADPDGGKRSVVIESSAHLKLQSNAPDAYLCSA